MRRSSALAGVGDGVVATALPLLAAGLTRDPLAVAAVVAAHHAPWAVVAVLGPAWLGQADRRTVLGLAATLRAAAVAGLGLLTLAGAETLVAVAAAALVMGVGEALADGAEEEAGAVVGEVAGGRLRRDGMAGVAVVGLPVGGLVYAVAAGLPFVLAVAVFALAALSGLSLPRPLPGVAVARGARESLVAPLAPGTGAPTLLAAVPAAATSGVTGVLVLFALDDLGLGAPAFGFLLAGLALAAAGGGLAAPTVGRILGLRSGIAVALLATGAGYTAAGVAADPARPLPAAIALAAGVAAGMVSGVLVRALLHAAAGRVVEGDALSGFHARVWGAIPIGALAGGLAARGAGVAAVLVGAGAVAALTALGVAGVTQPGEVGTSQKSG